MASSTTLPSSESSADTIDVSKRRGRRPIQQVDRPASVDGQRPEEMEEKDTPEATSAERVLVQLALMIRYEDWTTLGSEHWAHGQIRLVPRRGDAVAIQADAQGYASVFLAPGRYEVRTVDPFIFSESDSLDVKAGEGPEFPRTLSFMTGGQITGRVIDEVGTPVEGASVLCENAGWATDYDPMMGIPEISSQSRLTDEDGRFTFERLDPESVYTILAEHASAGTASTDLVSVAPHQVTFVPDLALQSGESFTLFVRESSGRPVQDAAIDCVEVVPGRDPVLMVARRGRLSTDAQGRASFDRLTAEQIEVRVRADGYAPWHRRLERPSRELTVQLERGHVVDGKVVGRDSEEPRPTTVQMHPILAEPRSLPVLPLEASVDADGSFRFEHVPAGRYEVAADGCRRLEIEVPTDSITLQRSVRTVSVRLFGPDGERYEEPCRVRVDSAHGDAIGDPAWRRSISTSAGSFELDVRLGSHTLVVLDSRNGLEGRASFEVTPESEPQSLVVHMQPLSLSIEGQVVQKETGQGIPGCRLEIEALKWEAVTDESGHFVLRASRPGEYRLRWRLPSQRGVIDWPIEQDIRIDRSEAPLRIEAERPGSVSGSVLVDGVPAEYAQVRFRFGRNHTGRDTRDGTYRFEGMPPGTYVLHCRSGFLAESREVAISAGEDVTVDFDLHDDRASLSGTLTRDGSPLAGARLTWGSWQTAYTWPMRHARTDAKGTFLLEELAAGPAFLQIEPANPGEYLSFTKNLDLGPSEVRHLDIDFETVRVTFRVRGADGRLLIDQRLELDSDHPELGRIEVVTMSGRPTAMPPGPYLVTLRGAESGAAPPVIEVTRSGELEIVLGEGLRVDIVFIDDHGAAASAGLFWAFAVGARHPLQGPVLPPGQYEVWARASSRELQRVGPIRVHGEEPMRFEFPMDPSGSARLESRSGHPVFTSRIFDEHGHELSFIGGAVDRFTLPPGPYRVWLASGDFVDFVIRPGEMTVVQVD